MPKPPEPSTPTGEEPEATPREEATPAAQPEASPPPCAFDLEKLLIDVFDPQPAEKVLIMIDLPHDTLADHGEWAARRQMAEEWRDAFQMLGDAVGFAVHPLLSYPATGTHNRPLPPEGEMDGQQARFDDVMDESTIVVALTEYSATASLIGHAGRSPDLRAASMPGVSKRMEQTALAADYGKVARKSQALADRLDRAVGADVEFSTGNRIYFDLRPATQKWTTGSSIPTSTAPVSSICPAARRMSHPTKASWRAIPARPKAPFPSCSVMNGFW